MGKGFQRPLSPDLIEAATDLCWPEPVLREWQAAGRNHGQHAGQGLPELAIHFTERRSFAADYAT